MNSYAYLKITLAWLAAAAAPAGVSAPAAELEDLGDSPEAMAVVRRANLVAYYQGADGRADVKMTITDERGQTRTREMTILRRDAADPNRKGDAGYDRKDDLHTGEQRFYVYFRRPADVNRMSFLVWKHLGKDDDRWLYLPGLDLVKRISAADTRTSFVGSHFFYEDVSGRGIHQDTHELLSASKTYYKIRSKPKDPQAVEFARYDTWIHRKTFVVVQQDYYDAQDKKIRQYKALGMKQIEGNWTVTKSRMADLRTGGDTVLEYSDVDYDVGLEEDIFTERYLRRPPLKYLGQ